MDLGLKGRRAVVSGASAGIGLELVRRLIEEGARVAGISRRSGPLAGLGDAVIPVSADLATAEGCERACREAVESLGGVDILVNNVGVTIARDGFLGVDDRAWLDGFETNVMSTVRMSRFLIPVMTEQGHGGAIVNLASVAAKQPTPPLVDYSAGKAAIVNLTKSMALEFAASGIRVNSVSPGPVRTRTWDGPGGYGDQLAERYGMDRDAAIDHFVSEVRQLPMGMGVPADVVDLICFLASDRSRRITGADHLIVDMTKTT